MKELDEIAKRNRAQWEQRVKEGERNTVPWLDLDVRALREFADGYRPRLPQPYAVGAESPEAAIIRAAKGKDVLCLASGGGQQSAVFGLLGARVTVLDLTPGQLEADRKAARHYGYEVRTVQGDMRDLGVFGAGSFDHVIQGISLTFVPDVRAVYREVFRVLRPDGLYAAAHCNPATYPISFDDGGNGWDGVGYRIAEPYRGGPILRSADGPENMAEGEPTGEHRHLYRDIFNGLIDCGFVLEKVWDCPWPELHETLPAPGSREHETCFDGCFSTLARKPGTN